MKAWNRPRRQPKLPAGAVPLAPVAVAVLVAVLALAVGCGGDADQAEDATGGDPYGSASTPESDGGGEASGCGGGFVTAAESSGGEAGAAGRIEGARFQVFDGYERLLIDFGRGGVPRWSVERPDQGGYVRLSLPDLTSTATAHEDLVGSALDELFVVREREGGFFADVFAMHEFRYRVTERPESGQLAVDFCGLPQEIDFPPTTSDRAVVLQPREAEELGGPLEVRGYTRLFEGRVTVSLRDLQGREVISSETVPAGDRTTAWSPFETTLEFSGYEGLATLRVGGRSPENGAFVGTGTEVFLESPGGG